MGLREKKATKQYQEGTFVATKEKLDGLLGFNIDIEVDWESLQEEGYSDSYEEFWTKVYFQPLMNALTELCADDFSKDAVAGGLKKIQIKNASGNSNDKYWAQFQGGVLTLDHVPCTNVDAIDDRARNLKTVLEDGL
jgi:hypothetical protein